MGTEYSPAFLLCPHRDRAESCLKTEQSDAFPFCMGTEPSPAVRFCLETEQNDTFQFCMGTEHSPAFRFYMYGDRAE